jgi:hypothetical protein
MEHGLRRSLCGRSCSAVTTRISLNNQTGVSKYRSGERGSVKEPIHVGLALPIRHSAECWQIVIHCPTSLVAVGRLYSWRERIGSVWECPHKSWLVARTCRFSPSHEQISSVSCSTKQEKPSKRILGVTLKTCVTCTHGIRLPPMYLQHVVNWIELNIYHTDKSCGALLCLMQE